MGSYLKLRGKDGEQGGERLFVDFRLEVGFNTVLWLEATVHNKAVAGRTHLLLTGSFPVLSF